jgi:hypothetical protein
MNTRFVQLSLFLAIVLLIVGCGGGTKLYPVEGVVTLDGEPLEGATVTFQSENTIAAGLTSASGKFRLITNGQEGAPAGTYKVVVKKISEKARAASPPVGSDPTEAYQQFMKANNMTLGPKGMTKPKIDSEIPERYGSPGAIPDQVVPSSGPIEIELKSK